MSRLSIETGAGSTHRKELRAACGHRFILGGLNGKGALEEASCGKTTYRLQKVVVKNEAYITPVAGAYEASPEEAPTLSLYAEPYH